MNKLQVIEKMNTTGIIDIKSFYSAFGLNFGAINFKSDYEVLELAKHILNKNGVKMSIDFDAGCTSFINKNILC